VNLTDPTGEHGCAGPAQCAFAALSEPINDVLDRGTKTVVYVTCIGTVTRNTAARFITTIVPVGRSLTLACGALGAYRLYQATYKEVSGG